QAGDLGRVACLGANFLPSKTSPDVDRLIPPAGGEMAAIGAEGQRQYGPIVALQRQKFPVAEALQVVPLPVPQRRGTGFEQLLGPADMGGEQLAFCQSDLQEIERSLGGRQSVGGFARLFFGVGPGSLRLAALVLRFMACGLGLLALLVGPAPLQ